MESAHSLANKYVQSKIDIVNDEIQALILSSDGVVGSQELRAVIGRELALAFAIGYIDKKLKP